MNHDMNNFDCRTVQKGKKCEHLTPWNIDKKDELARICTCKALNVIIFPNYRNLGKVNQELLSVKPLFHCPVLQKLRAQDKAPNVVATIGKNYFTTWNND